MGDTKGRKKNMLKGERRIGAGGRRDLGPEVGKKRRRRGGGIGIGRAVVQDKGK